MSLYVSISIYLSIYIYIYQTNTCSPRHRSRHGTLWAEEPCSLHLQLPEVESLQVRTRSASGSSVGCSWSLIQRIYIHYHTSLHETGSCSNAPISNVKKPGSVVRYICPRIHEGNPHEKTHRKQKKKTTTTNKQQQTTKNTVWNRMTASVIKQDPNTKRFKQRLIYFNTDTQYAHFRGNSLCEATKRHFNNRYTVKNDEQWKKKTNPPSTEQAAKTQPKQDKQNKYFSFIFHRF